MAFECESTVPSSISKTRAREEYPLIFDLLIRNCFDRLKLQPCVYKVLTSYI